MPLPRVPPPELERLRRALGARYRQGVETHGPAALSCVDKPVVRARLARALLALRDAQRLDEKLAAAGILELASGSTLLLWSALVQTLAVHAGVTRTPGAAGRRRRLATQLGLPLSAYPLLGLRRGGISLVLDDADRSGSRPALAAEERPEGLADQVRLRPPRAPGEVSQRLPELGREGQGGLFHGGSMTTYCRRHRTLV
ncbi:MAG TPA: hypothetical protein VG452_07475, partial [Egibacteraceae bacterium]|nr:hypothetical protein [Egibacteraceae bacterium]